MTDPRLNVYLRKTVLIGLGVGDLIERLSIDSYILNSNNYLPEIE